MKRFSLLIVLLAVAALMLSAGCGEKDKKAWEKAEKYNTKEAYNEFITKYPNSQYAKDAKNAIEKLEWRAVLNENTIEAYRNYMTENPGSKYYKLAQNKVKELHNIYSLIDELEKAHDQEDITKIAFSLASYDNTASIAPLVELIKSEDTFKSSIGALSLGHLGREEAVFDMLELAKSYQPLHRKHAAWVLGRLQVKNDKVINALIGLLSDTDSEVRMYAAWALGRLEVKKAMKNLQALAKRSPDADDSKEAAKALDAINKKFYNPTIKNQPPWLLVPEKDIPFTVAHSGPILTLNIVGSAEAWGYIFKESDTILPLKVSNWNSVVIYWGGKGKVEDKWLWKTISLEGKYYPNVDQL